MTTFTQALRAPFDDRLFWAKRKFRSKRATYYSDLAERMETQSGTRITRFIELDAERYPHLPIGKLAQHWLTAFRAHGSFSEAIRGTVPDEDIAVIAISERAGDLTTGLRNLAASVSALESTREAVRVVLMALTFVALLVHFYCGLYGFKIVPTIEQQIPASINISDLGFSAIFLHGLRFAVENFWLPWLMFIFGAAAWIKWAVPNYIGRLRPWLDRHILFFQLYREFQAATFLTSLASITQRINNKVIPIPQALELMEETATPWLRWHIHAVLMRLEDNPQGKGESFATGLVNQETVYRMSDIAEYADMSDMLDTVGKQVLKRAPIEMEKRSNRIQLFARAIMVAVVLGISWAFNFMSYSFQQALTLDAFLR